jgi:predicted GNAT family acetyltransferase
VIDTTRGERTLWRVSPTRQLTKTDADAFAAFVITLPTYRGQGLAKATVRAISVRALSQGYEPQYRCQLGNAPSIALAESAGFVRFGTWDVISEM